MDKKLMEKFLVQSTVPNKKKDRVYDCIWRAHRDVLTGRFHLPCYCKKINDTPISRKVIDSLYSLIQKDNACVYSKKLIEDLCDLYPDIEFGAIQKIVNMSLKYLLILKEFEGLEIRIDEKNCDCPLDSIILNSLKQTVSNLPDTWFEQCGIDMYTIAALKSGKVTWTSINKKQYDDIQKTIGGLTKNQGSNLSYDFENWNKEKK